MEVRLGCVVEGHGGRDAVPLLIRRIAHAADPATPVEVLHPIRIPRSKLLRPGELEKAVTLAALNVGGRGGILIVLDSEEDCPASLGPELLGRARAAAGHLPISVVLPKWEYEAWFLAAAESLRGKRGLALDLESPSDPEAIQGQS